MKIGCSQRIIKTGNLEENLNHFVNDLMLYADKGVDIVVFPEMWATGFDYKNILEHSRKTEAIIEEVSKKLKNFQLAILSLPENDNNEVYNTIFAVDSSGVIARYRKIFLFSPLKEDVYFKKGDFEISVFTFNSVKISLHTCYEIRFPELFRIAAYNGSQLMIVPAIWPDFKKYHWLTLLRARAIENQTFVVGCNAYEVDNNGKTIKCGHSAVFDPWGESVAYIENVSDLMIAEMDLSKLLEVRQAIPSLKDASGYFKIDKIKSL
jgi:predicted amidohydrolase